MKLADYLADFLVNHGVTDAFGLPGGVILEMIYAFQNTNGKLVPHLSYHEQGAGFEALGYAQMSGRLGVAYATRGPGFTNLLTAIADAYCDSIPVLFITSHATSSVNTSMRIEANQEIDSCRMVTDIVKYAKRIDYKEEFQSALQTAYIQATTGRKGPVFLDVYSKLWKEDIDLITNEVCLDNDDVVCDKDLENICSSICTAKRPIILIGDGVNQYNARENLLTFAQKAKIPVLSSRYAHDVIGDSDFYFGYIGSFGVRYSNFILSKADLILSMGNRLNFPVNSASYKEIPQKAKILRVEIDKGEFNRDIPNAINYNFDLRSLLGNLNKSTADLGNHDYWFKTCCEIRDCLWDEDVNDVVLKVGALLNNAKHQELAITNDVGNNEFWISRANVHTSYKGKNLYSKSFATLGCSLPKAIGAFYASRKPVICFTGDQGFQMNIQELQIISSNQLPILIVVMNNYASGMIRDKENKTYGYCLHSTKDSGYEMPDLKIIAKAYNIQYKDSEELELDELGKLSSCISAPTILNLHIDKNLMLEPYLPIGRKTQDMEPKINSDKYNYLNQL